MLIENPHKIKRKIAAGIKAHYGESAVKNQTIRPFKLMKIECPEALFHPS